LKDLPGSGGLEHGHGRALRTRIERGVSPGRIAGGLSMHGTSRQSNLTAWFLLHMELVEHTMDHRRENDARHQDDGQAAIERVHAGE